MLNDFFLILNSSMIKICTFGVLFKNFFEHHHQHSRFVDDLISHVPGKIQFKKTHSFFLCLLQNFDVILVTYLNLTVSFASVLHLEARLSKCVITNVEIPHEQGYFTPPMYFYMEMAFTNSYYHYWALYEKKQT